MATSTIPDNKVIISKKFTSNSFSVTANGKCDIILNSNTDVSGYTKFFYRMSSGSTIQVRNNLILYGWPNSAGEGIHALEIYGQSASGTAEIQIYYVKNEYYRIVS